MHIGNQYSVILLTRRSLLLGNTVSVLVETILSAHGLIVIFNFLPNWYKVVLSVLVHNYFCFSLCRKICNSVFVSALQENNYL